MKNDNKASELLVSYNQIKIEVMIDETNATADHDDRRRRWLFIKIQ